jgi:hypothetical protein
MKLAYEAADLAQIVGMDVWDESAEKTSAFLKTWA